MTLETLCLNKALFDKVNGFLKSDEGILLVSALRDKFGRPSVPNADLVNEHTSSFCLGECKGAWDVIDTLENFGTFREQESPEESYGAIVEPKQKEKK